MKLLHPLSCQVSVTCLIEAFLALKGLNAGSEEVFWNFFESLIPFSPQALSAVWELSRWQLLLPVPGLPGGTSPAEMCSPSGASALPWTCCLTAANRGDALRAGSEPTWDCPHSLGTWQRACPCVARVRGRWVLLQVPWLRSGLRACVSDAQWCELCRLWVPWWQSRSSTVMPLEVFSALALLWWQGRALLGPHCCGATGQKPGQEATTCCSSGPGGMQLIAPLYIVVCWELAFGWLCCSAAPWS